MCVFMCLFFYRCRDLDDTASLEDMSFERIRPERGSMTSVNSVTTTCTTDSSSSGSSYTVPKVSTSCIHQGDFSVWVFTRCQLCVRQ